jgi:hypothetical protein
MNMTDQELLITAVRSANRIIAEHLAASSHEASN